MLLQSRARKGTRTALAVCVCLVASTHAFAADPQDDKVSMSMGLRTWIGQWSANGGGVRMASLSTPGYAADVIAHIDSSSTTAVVPFISARYRDWGVSASTMLKKEFTLENPASVLPFDRQEWDINGLYYFAPAASVSLGYKSIKWGDVKYAGPLAGLSASAPVSGTIGMYGTVAYGRLKFEPSAVSAGYGFSSAMCDYNLVEFGMSHSFGKLASASNVAVTFGYRHQRITSNNIWPIHNNVNSNVTYTSVRDTVSGPTLGVVMGF